MNVTHFGTTNLGQELNAIVEHVQKVGGREWHRTHIVKRLPINMEVNQLAKLIGEELEIETGMVTELLLCYAPYGGEVFFHMNMVGNVDDEICDAAYTIGDSDMEQKDVANYVNWLADVIEKVSRT